MKKTSRRGFRRFHFSSYPKRLWSLMRERPEVIVGIFVMLFIGLTLELSAVGIDHIFEKHLNHEPVPKASLWFTGTCLILAFFSSAVAWLARDAFLKLQVQPCIESSTQPKPYLVFFVSPQKILTNEDQIPTEGLLQIDDIIALERKSPKDDADFLDRTKATEHWPWSMILRGIDPHLSKLERIYLLGSGDKKSKPGSFVQLEILRRFLSAYLVAAGKKVTGSGAGQMIVTWSVPMDFENFEDVYDNLEALHGQLEEEGVKDCELCVDITGGQKPNSAAAGLFTVKSDVLIQYVQTNLPKSAGMHDVRMLDWPDKAE
jgi:hypothetical protein